MSDKNWQQFEVAQYGKNNRSDYYKVNNITVVHTPNDVTPFLCCECRLSDCGHVKRLRQWLE